MLVSTFLAKIKKRSVDIALRSFTETLPPLYHYTTGEGLHGILQSGTLRGSNYAFMNDRSEFIYGVNLLRELVQERLAAGSSPTQQRLYELVLIQDAFSEADLYLTCFCEKGDLISQWRGYGAQDSRYCLEFDAIRFRPAVEDYAPLPVMPVIYDKTRQQELIREILHLHDEALTEVPATELEIAIPKLAQSVHAACLPIFAFFKDDAFHQEEEWRSVFFIIRGAHWKHLEFGSHQGMLKPALPMLSGDDGKLPIRRVIAGASRGPQQSFKAAQLLLRRFEYVNVPVDYSRVPLSG